MRTRLPLPLPMHLYLQIKDLVQECDSCGRDMTAYDDESGRWTFYCFCGETDGPYDAEDLISHYQPFC